MGTRLFLALNLTLASLCPAYGANPVSAPSDAAAPASAPAQVPVPAGAFAQVDTLIAETSSSLKTLQECLQLAQSMKADASKKNAELKAEFGATIPPAFNELLSRKRSRADKQQALCAQAAPRTSELYAQAHALIRQFEPKSLPGLPARSKKLDEINSRYNLLFPYSKGTKK